MIISRFTVGQTVNGTLVLFPQVHDGLGHPDFIHNSCLVLIFARWLQLCIDVLGARGLVHVEIAFQDPFLEMIRLFGRLWHLLDWLLRS